MASIREVQRKKIDGIKAVNGIAYTVDLTARDTETYGLAIKGEGFRTTRGTYRTKTEATKALDEIIKDSDNQKIMLATSSANTLSDAFNVWKSKTDVAASTLDLYEDCWAHLSSLADKPMTEIGYQNIEDLLNSLNFSDSRIKSIRTLLSHCFKQALRQKWIAASPMAAVQLKSKGKSKPRIRYWDSEQTKKFLKAITRARYKEFYELALHTGCRRGELLGLKWENVDFKSNTLKIAHSWNGDYGLTSTKTGVERSIKLRDDEMKILSDIFFEGLVWVFQRPDKEKPYAVQSIVREFTNLCDTAGVPRIGLHGLRHTHATLLLASGSKVEVVSKRLGHSKTAITMDTYRHVMPAEDEELADTLGSLLD